MQKPSPVKDRLPSARRVTPPDHISTEYQNSTKSSFKWPTLAIHLNDWMADIGRPTTKAHIIHYMTYKEGYNSPPLHISSY